MNRVLTSQAEDELTEAAHWYEERCEGLGVEFIEEADRVFGAIEERPEHYQIVHLDIRRANLRRFPYSVYFVVHRGTIGILAVHHSSRDPRRWKWRRSEN